MRGVGGKIEQFLVQEQTAYMYGATAVKAALKLILVRHVPRADLAKAIPPIEVEDGYEQTVRSVEVMPR